jgi:hypothetical protein
MENEPQKKQKYKIIITIIVCLLIGMIPGYLLGANLNNNNTDIVNDTEEVEEELEEVEEETNEEENNQEDEIVSKEEIEIQEKKEDTKPQEKKEDIQKDESKTQEKVEEKQKEEIPKAPESSQKVETITGTNPVINLKNECFNSQVCTKEYILSNNKKTIKIKIKKDTYSKDLYINNDSIYYEDYILINQIALLDNNILVIETETKGPNGNNIERSYLSDNLTILFENNILDLREGYFKEDITAKEFTGYSYSLTCGNQGGVKQSVYKIKLISPNEISQNFISSNTIYVAQC